MSCSLCSMSAMKTIHFPNKWSNYFPLESRFRYVCFDMREFKMAMIKAFSALKQPRPSPALVAPPNLPIAQIQLATIIRISVKFLRLVRNTYNPINWHCTQNKSLLIVIQFVFDNITLLVSPSLRNSSPFFSDIVEPWTLQKPARCCRYLLFQRLIEDYLKFSPIDNWGQFPTCCLQTINSFQLAVNTIQHNTIANF